MHWTWVSLLLCCGVVVWFVYIARVRSSIQKYADDLRKVMRDMQQQTQQLTSVREAARESKKESLRRVSELKELRCTIESLTSALNTSTSEKQALKESIRGSQELVTDLRRRLARSEARCKKLEAEVAAASLTRWELLSKLHDDTTQRLIAINYLRQPQNGALLRDMGSPPSRQFSEHSLSPIAMPKSPSESCLLSLKPDLSVSDDDNENGDDLDGYGGRGEEGGLEEIAIGASYSGLGTSNGWRSNRSGVVGRREENSALRLVRAPWVDSMRVLLEAGESHGSLANALQPEVSGSWSGVKHVHHSSKDASASASARSLTGEKGRAD